MTTDPEQHTWSVTETDYNGVPLSVRINESARAFVGDPEFGIKLGFAVPLKSTNDTNLPASSEEQALTELEDRIIATVADGAEGIHVMTLANAHMKELVFYIKEGADIDEMYASLRDSEANYDVQCHADRDRQWDAFTAFLPDQRAN